MRDPSRLDKFYAELCEIHKKYFGQWRFGQFICNLAREYPNTDFFFPEEEKMLQMFRDFAEKYGRRSDNEDN